MQQIFIFGTLQDLNVLSAVLGRSSDGIEIRDAVLAGYNVYAVKGQGFPILREHSEGQAHGKILSAMSAIDVSRLEYYEGAFGYTLAPAVCLCGGETVKAEVFLTDSDNWQPDGEWSLENWILADKGVSAEAAKEVMSYFPERPAQGVGQHFGGIRTRAQSSLYAKNPRSSGLHSKRSAQDVTTLALKHPYLGFFAMEERELTFLKFGGEQSEPVRRATFLLADAVTVLPYDPKTDNVLLIEQFRAGPMGRGDSNPWCLEPIAGRVDVGEQYEETAHREMMEEANIGLLGLEEIGRYYSSPGAVSEFLISYIGIADLNPDDAGIHGLETEAEDIRSLIIPFDRLMTAVDDGELDTGPLLVSALWLYRHKDRLQGKYGTQ